jgi:hypothetical protein
MDTEISYEREERDSTAWIFDENEHYEWEPADEY